MEKLNVTNSNDDPNLHRRSVFFAFCESGWIQTNHPKDIYLFSYMYTVFVASMYRIDLINKPYIFWGILYLFLLSFFIILHFF